MVRRPRRWNTTLKGGSDSDGTFVDREELDHVARRISGSCPRCLQGAIAGAERSRVFCMDLDRVTAGPLPMLAAGAGAPLLYLGGLLPVAGVDSRLAVRAAGYSAGPFSGVRRVLYVNRRAGLSPGTTIAAIAAEHAEAIDALGCGPVDVLGVSTGGSIAQQLAADHPESVRRLVLVSTGCRLTPKTRRMQARVAQLIRAGHQEQAVASMVVGVLFPQGEPLARLVAPFVGRLAGHLGDLADLATTIEAEDTFDLTLCDGTISAPTLIMAGTRDRFYPPQLLEETQRLIPDSELDLIPRRGHLTVMTGPRWSARVRTHLQE